MRLNIHPSIRAPEAATASLSDAPFYPEDLLPALQDTLAALADLEVRFEIARDRLEEWSGPEAEKQRHRIELEQLHQQVREPYLQHLAGLQEQIRGTRCATDPARLEPTAEGAMRVREPSELV